MHVSLFEHPIGTGRHLAVVSGRPGQPIIDEVDVVAHEHLVLDRDPLADERVALDLAAPADRDAALDLDEGADAGLVTDRAAVQIHEGEYPDIPAKHHVGGNALRGGERLAHELGAESGERTDGSTPMTGSAARRGF